MSKVRNVAEVAAAENWRNRKWLIAGKGPSFHAEAIRRHADSIALNHVVEVVDRVKIAHCIDLEVAVACADAIREHAEYLLMPWCPNINLRLQGRPLRDLACEYKILGEMLRAGRLLSYNRVESPRQHPGFPRVSAIHFSAEAAFGVLAICGVKRIETVGIDGGRDYAAPFTPLTPLENGQPSFDRQLPHLRRIVKRHGILWTRLDLDSTA